MSQNLQDTIDVPMHTTAERQIVVAALENQEWNTTRAAEQLGLSDHASLRKIMRRLGLKKR